MAGHESEEKAEEERQVRVPLRHVVFQDYNRAYVAASTHGGFGPLVLRDRPIAAAATAPVGIRIRRPGTGIRRAPGRTPIPSHRLGFPARPLARQPIRLPSRK